MDPVSAFVGAATGGVFGLGMGSQSARYNRRAQARNHEYTMQQMGAQNRYTQQNMHLQSDLDKGYMDYMFDTAKGMGLTPQETWGISGGGNSGPSAGSGGGGGGGIGNLTDFGTSQAAMQMGTSLAIENIRSKTAKDVAKISNIPKHGANIVERFKIEVTEGLKQQEIDIATEHARIASERWDIEQHTITPYFLLKTKAMTMGVDNMVASGIYEWFKERGIDVLNQEGKLIPAKQFSRILNSMRSQNSTFLKEFGALIEVMRDIEEHGIDEFTTPNPNAGNQSGTNTRPSGRF